MLFQPSKPFDAKVYKTVHFAVLFEMGSKYCNVFVGKDKNSPNFASAKFGLFLPDHNFFIHQYSQIHLCHEQFHLNHQLQLILGVRQLELTFALSFRRP